LFESLLHLSPVPPLLLKGGGRIGDKAESGGSHHEYGHRTLLVVLYVIQYFLGAGAAFAAAGANSQLVAQTIDGRHAAANGAVNVAIGNVIADTNNHGGALKNKELIS